LGALAVESENKNLQAKPAVFQTHLKALFAVCRSRSVGHPLTHKEMPPGLSGRHFLFRQSRGMRFSHPGRFKRRIAAAY
jgi:hypothetical protein